MGQASSSPDWRRAFLRTLIRPITWFFFSKFKFKQLDGGAQEKREEGRRRRREGGLRRGMGRGRGRQRGSRIRSGRRGCREETESEAFPTNLPRGGPQPRQAPGLVLLACYCLPPSHPPQIQMFSSTRVRPGLHGRRWIPTGHFICVSVSSLRS